MGVKIKKGGKGKIGERVKAPKGRYIHKRLKSPKSGKGRYITIRTKSGKLLRIHYIGKKSEIQSILKPIKRRRK